MTDCIIPEVTLEEADTITRNAFGNHALPNALIELVRLILTEDRRRVASLQDPWVEITRGAVIPGGVRYRVEYRGKYSDGSACEYVSGKGGESPTTVGTVFVRRSDLPKVIPSKSRRERIIDEVMKDDVWPKGLMSVRRRAMAGEWLDAIETAVKVVDGDE